VERGPFRHPLQDDVIEYVKILDEYEAGARPEPNHHFHRHSGSSRWAAVHSEVRLHAPRPVKR
jgi:hypothetical protein